MAAKLFQTTATEAEIDQIIRQPMSWDEYLNMPTQYRTADGFVGDIYKVEWVAGEAIIMMAAMRKAHSNVTYQLERLLRDSLIGAEVYHEVGYRTSEGVLVPDIIVVEEGGDDDPVWVNRTPLVVIEVLSPSTRNYDLLEKSDRYQAWGARQSWIADTDGWLVIRENTEDGWKMVALIDSEHPEAQVAVGTTGVVTLRYGDIFGNLAGQ